MQNMPSLDMDKFNEFVLSIDEKDQEVVKRVFRIVKKDNKVQVRRSRPKDELSYYVWRNVVFNVSMYPEHQCMPIMAEIDIYNYVRHTLGVHREKAHVAVKDLCSHLDELVDKIVNLFPKNEWYGVKKWARALGAF